MSFSDEDLKRVTALSKTEMCQADLYTKLPALLARLTAAEALIEQMAPPLRMMKLPKYEAWLESKFAGKPQGEERA